ncbi:hypothetical protein W97_07840 [Coniosporium apollinis CBS 100218]|uniref:Uncharacterized protein n=1 Tax=Coniosporium apollinis (strain CBS 100218) TaxID=1168221 RepID=R7Z365_CONA1|nr:uncharacterized protein W97_07840 [Coniosporium apollinis CBS 100218]EON68582.1 hypothetical protein W97_07840 [Coniosporium apollinis CBS 100218]
MSGPQPPYALFVIAQGVNVDYINDSLTRAWKGDFEAAWELYLATDDYEDAPKKRSDNELSEGTRAPISTDFKFPFIGKTLEDCAKWLQRAPDEVELNREYFTALGEHSKEDDTVMLCRIVDSDDAGNVTLQYFPVPTGDAVVEMQTTLGVKFDEKLQNYQRQRMQDGKPDRSKGEPYA